ncbi:MAG: hypothetical protein FIB08_02990 [Candidatus Methanoperedens sp.]|nr:hypothetical protein [Candidatus Methanoperedens sp.]
MSRFTGWKYISRGKASLSIFGDEPFLLVGEHKGNPGSFVFYSGGTCVLSIRMSVSRDEEIGCGAEPVLEGNNELARALGRVTGLITGGNGERVIHVNGRIEFIDKGVSYIVLTVLAVRGEGIVRPV